MRKVTIDEAVARLEELIDDAADGREVVIAHPNGIAVRLVPVPTLGTPRYGSARGMFSIADDSEFPVADLRAKG